MPDRVMYIAIALMAVNRKLIYYSNEFKQYSIDLMFTCLILALAVHVDSKKSIKGFIAFGLVGTLAILLSHPSIFVLTAVGIVWIVRALFARDWSDLKKRFIVFTPWVVAFVLFFFIDIQSNSNNDFMVQGWQSSFFPLFKFSMISLHWYFDTFFALFRDPLDFMVPSLAAFLFLIGIMVVCETLFDF